VFVTNAFHGVSNKKELSEVVHEALKPGGNFAIINRYRPPGEAIKIMGQSQKTERVLRAKPEDASVLLHS
jgi:predicted methyltransferase